MPWSNGRKNWLPFGGHEKNPKLRTSLTVAEASGLLSIDRQTVYKYIDTEVIPDDGWFKLPGGHIRIFEWAILNIQGVKMKNRYRKGDNR